MTLVGCEGDSSGVGGGILIIDNSQGASFLKVLISFTSHSSILTCFPIKGKTAIEFCSLPCGWILCSAFHYENLKHLDIELVGYPEIYCHSHRTLMS